MSFRKLKESFANDFVGKPENVQISLTPHEVQIVHRALRESVPRWTALLKKFLQSDASPIIKEKSAETVGVAHKLTQKLRGMQC